MVSKGSGLGLGRFLAASALVVFGAGITGQAVGVAPETPHDVATEGPSGSGITSVRVAPSGNVEKDIGESAGLTLAGSDHAYFEFVVEGIEVLVSCPGRGVTVPTRNGYFVVVNLRAQMSDAVSQAVKGGSELFMPLTADAFRLVGADGPVAAETLTDASWACFGSDVLAEPFVGPGEETAGLVVLDSPISSGTLVYAPAGRGWEWTFGE